MTKITRIADILNGTGVEREGDHLQAFHDLWHAASAIESPKYIPVGQWVIDAFDDARREAGQAVDEPMDPVTAGQWLAPPAERHVQYGEVKVTVRPGETFADAWTREGR